MNLLSVTKQSAPRGKTANISDGAGSDNTYVRSQRRGLATLKMATGVCHPFALAAPEQLPNYIGHCYTSVSFCYIPW